jgi:ribosomal protein S18 acetylase RimI-like enzyme
MMTLNKQFRALSTQDLPEVLRIVTDIQKHPVPGFFWNEADLRSEFQVAKAFGCFSSSRDALLSSDQKDSNFGVLNGEASILSSFLLVRAVDDRLWDITLLGVDPAFWGQGLMKFVLQTWLQSTSTPCEVWLEVHSQNQQALAFYQKQGFLITGRRSNYYRDGGDALLMVLKRT